MHQTWDFFLKIKRLLNVHPIQLYKSLGSQLSSWVGDRITAPNSLMGPFLLSICCWFCLIHRTREYQGEHHIQLGEWGQTSSTIILVANQYHCVEIENNVEMVEYDGYEK